MMSDTFQRELREFDTQRVLSAWDGLVAKQQGILENHAVPTMFSTTSHNERDVRKCFTLVLFI
jgi:hypothetical protein